MEIYIYMDESVTHAYRTFFLVEDLDMKISWIIDCFAWINRKEFLG